MGINNLLPPPFFFSFLFVEDGIVALWGLNQHGQCGVGEKTESFSLTTPVDQVSVTDTNWISNVYLPRDVGGLPTVSEVHCGWSHTVIVSGKSTRCYIVSAIAIFTCNWACKVSWHSLFSPQCY